LQKVGIIGLTDLSDFTPIDYNSPVSENAAKKSILWKQFLRFIQSKKDNTIMGKAVKIMQAKKSIITIIDSLNDGEKDMISDYQIYRTYLIQ
jgi:CBS-domain-containing membrane protein